MKMIITFVLMTTLMSISAYADIKKGQKAYLKQCKKCHGNGVKGSAMKTQKQWDEAFKNEAAVFKEWHLQTKAAKYTKGKKFKKSAQHLRDFLYEYGSDSGNAPGC